MNQTAGEKLDKATSAVHSVIDDAARKVQAPLDRVAALAHDASDKAVAAGTQATEWASKQGTRLAAAPKQLVNDASGYISANPLKSMGIAVVAALIVGRLMR